MNFKSIIAGAVLGALLLLGGIYTGLHSFVQQTATKFGDTTIQPVYAANTNTGFLCTSTSGQLVATSSNPGFLSISNDSSVGVYLSLGLPPAVAHQGIYLPASTTIQFNQSNFYAWPIYCITASGNASTTISETK